MANPRLLKNHRNSIIILVIIVSITTGNYYLNSGEKSDWITISEYGFTLQYPPQANIWITGVDENNVFDPYGDLKASQSSGMIGFNINNDEFAVTWVTLDEGASFEDILDVNYNSVEVNSLLRNRTLEMSQDPLTYGDVNGHKTAFQTHFIELDMPDSDTPLFGKGVVIGWTCDRTGVSYVSYRINWSTGKPSDMSEETILHNLIDILVTLHCH
jgi:hypothetical protein